MRSAALGSTTPLWMCALLTFSGCADCGSGGTRGGGEGGDGDGDAGQGACIDTEFRCEGQVAYRCDADSAPPVDCASMGKSCSEDHGCIECEPGAKTCTEGKATFCRDDGTLAQFECDPEQGMVCKPEGCEGACTLDQVSQSYIGCDYYPTMTLNPVWNGFAFAVAVSNASSEEARVVITGPADYSVTKMVAPETLETFELPWVNELKGGDAECSIPPAPGSTRLVAGGAYRVRSNHPVTVYQFSPLHYELSPAPDACPLLSECNAQGESPPPRSPATTP